MKIRCQVMLERKYLNFLEVKQKEYKHKNLSQTLNWLLYQIKMLEKSQSKQETKEKNNHPLDELEKKYGIGEK